MLPGCVSENEKISMLGEAVTVGCTTCSATIPTRLSALGRPTRRVVVDSRLPY